MYLKKITKRLLKNRQEREAFDTESTSVRASVDHLARDVSQSTAQSQQTPARQPALLLLSQNVEPSQSTPNPADEVAQSLSVTIPEAAQDGYSRTLPSLKERPYGLKVLYQPDNASGALVDIVFIHGLTGSTYTTWLQKRKQVYWPIDLLSRDVADARILAFGYDADVTKLLGPVSQNNLRHHAADLLNDLAALRNKTNSEHRKMVFIVHSLGGLVMKKAMCISETSNEEHLKQVDRYTIAIAFLGTPHRGAGLASFATVVANILRAGGKRVNKQILGLLKQGSEVLSDVEDSFEIWLSKKDADFNVSCFYEELELPGLGKVVTYDSAKLGAFPRLAIHADHMHMTKFAAATDTGYERILGQIERWLKPLKSQEAKATGMTNEEQACLQSLFFPEMDDRRFNIEKPADGTCLWLPKHTIYLKWLNQRCGLLWIKGSPGTGKSTLVKHVLEANQYESSHRTVVVSFFFHGRGTHIQRSPLGLFRALLHQILQEIPTLLTTFAASFKRKCETRGEPGKKWEWGEKELQDLLETYVMNAARRCRLRIYIDALDECGEDVARNLALLFLRLTSKQTSDSGSLSICFSCRHYPQVALEGGLEICIEKENPSDITTYVQNRFGTELLDKRKAQVLQEEILGKASGAFQWVVIIVDRSLKRCGQGMSLQAIQAEIRDLPTELDDLYREIIGKTDKNDLPQTLQLMQWICCAFRPLSMAELRIALAVDHETRLSSLKECKNTAEYVETDEDMEKRVQHLSRGLAEVKSSFNGPVVQFIHQSVKDYLSRVGLRLLDGYSASNHIAVGRAHHRLSRSCIKYIAMEEIDSVVRQAKISAMPFVEQYDQFAYRARARELPLLDYAINHWIPHAEVGESKQICQGDIFNCLQWPSLHVPQRWVSLDKLGRPDARRFYNFLYEGESLLHVASRHGLLSILTAGVNITNGAKAYINSKNSRGMTPLMYATTRGHIAIVEFLMKQPGIDINSKDSYGRTPLIFAIIEGHIAIVEFLMKQPGIDVNSKDSDGQTPLMFATIEGHIAIVEFLLKQPGIDVTSEDDRDQTPLLYAMHRGHITITEVLRKQLNIDIDFKDSRYRTTLLSAAESGHTTMVEFLLEQPGTDVNFKDHGSKTALNLAADRGHTAIVEFLLKQPDIDVNHRGDKGQTALSVAAVRGDTAIVEFLLKHADIDVNSRDDSGQTALSVAAERGDTAIVELLLKHADIDVNSRDNYGRTALSVAAERGDTAIVKLLLRRSEIKVNLQDKMNRTALLLAAREGQTFVVELLLKRSDVNINHKDIVGHTALCLAAMRGHTSMKELISMRGGKYM